MKTPRLLLPALVVLACAISASAQPGPAAARGAGSPTGLPDLATLKSTLNLTDAQAAQVAPLLAEIAAAQQLVQRTRLDYAGAIGAIAPRAAITAGLSEQQRSHLVEAVTPSYFTSQVPLPAGSNQHVDWPSRLTWDLADLKVYREANAQLGPPAPGESRVVFIGDSITENWQRSFATLYPGKSNFIGRGRTSETTQQMLLRFRPDVIDLKPKAVVLLAGTNDIAGNFGRSTDKMIQDNLSSMIDLASLNKIKVVLCATLPTTRYSWQPSVTDGTVRVIALNQWIKAYAATRPGEVFFVDTHTPLAAENGGMNPQFSSDGTHPNAQGYARISPLVEQAIATALAAK
jgi:lysophospholipase L1-like esterase